MGQRSNVEKAMSAMTHVEGVVAIPPNGRAARVSGDAEGANTAGLEPSDVTAFQNAGWDFVPASAHPDGDHRQSIAAVTGG